MDLDVHVITETWLTGKVSNQKFVGGVIIAGYSFHHAARIHKKGEGNGILIGDSLKCEAHLRFHVFLQKQSVSAKVISNIKYKSIDKGAFLADLRVSSLVLDLPDDVGHLVNLYDTTLRDTVDEHAPLRTKEMPRRPMLPW